MDDKANNSKPTLEVIGVGLSRTGTMSLKAAFETLGYGPCSHFKVAIVDKGFPYRESRMWQEALRTEDVAKRRQIIRRIYNESGWRSAADYPTAGVVEDLVEMYPDAKFVLGTRSSAQAWRKSWNNTLQRLNEPVYQYLGYPILQQRLAIHPLMEAIMKWDMRRIGATLYDATDGGRMYERHNEFVRRVVPRERLLEFESPMGWGPICKFLDVPVPRDAQGMELPFPRENDTKAMNRILTIYMTVGVLHWVVLFGAAWWAARTLTWRIWD